MSAFPAERGPRARFLAAGLVAGLLALAGPAKAQMDSREGIALQNQILQLRQFFNQSLCLHLKFWQNNIRRSIAAICSKITTNPARMQIDLIGKICITVFFRADFP